MEVKSGTQLTVTLKGILDHSFDISLIKLQGIQSLLINMHEVTFINSAGIRQFLSWIRELEKTRKDIKVILTLVPPTVNRLLATLQTHLPSFLSVDSVYLPYYCENCDFEDRSRLVTKQDVAKAEPLQIITDQQIPCPKCGTLMDFDGVADQYFSLLKVR